MLELKEIDWDRARVVVSEKRRDWYEEFDEAEGGFMGWRKIKGHSPISFLSFAKWLKRSGLEERVRISYTYEI